MVCVVCCLLSVGCWLILFFCWLAVVQCWLLCVVRCVSFVVYWLVRVFRCWLFGVLVFVVSRLFVVARVSIACCLLCVVSLRVVCWLVG